MILIRIVAPHFVAGYDTASGNIAPIIRYMKGWTTQHMKDYCMKNQWQFEMYWGEVI